jgi:hypothetical protein
MAKPNGFIALMLILAILCTPFDSAPDTGLASESPQELCGGSASPSEPHEDNEDSAAQVLAVVIAVIIVFFILYCITGADNQSHERR